MAIDVGWSYSVNMTLEAGDQRARRTGAHFTLIEDWATR